MHFLAGLPRSGSTVLAAVLNQHPQVRVTPTSGLIDVMGAVCFAWENNPSMKTRSRDGIYRMLRALVETEGANVDKPVLIDKSRGWPAPSVMRTMTDVLGRSPRIVATVRHVPDCAASFVRLVKPEDVKTFLRTSPLIAHLQSAYVTLHQGFEAAPDNFCFVDYDELVAEPQATLDRIHAFLGLNGFTYDFEHIDDAVIAENDEDAWGVSGLHAIRPNLEKIERPDSSLVLGDLYATFLQPEFWKPAPEERPPFLIDLQKEANMRGDFAKGWEIAQQLEAVSPGDDRAAFNRGWHVLWQGKLQEGMRLLHRGRADDIFGNPNPGTAMPLWNGESGSTVLLNLESGFGDQLHSARFARDIAARGCKVVLAGCPELMPVLKDCPGVSSACAKAAGPMTYHDFWLPAMSAPIPLGLEWDTVDGSPYIPRPKRQRERGRFRIGLRWRGNPKIEHDAQRLFPPRLLFDAVSGIKADFVCLQRDDGFEDRPSWVSPVPLGTWKQTAREVAECDLIITSCTSVAHLSAGMGVPTWVVVPILPYYLWSFPGDRSPWYDAVRLFRQETYGDWHAPFEKIKKSLAIEVRRAA